MGGWAQNGYWGDRLGEYRVNPVGSGQGPVAGCCKYGDEPSGSGATEFVQTFTVLETVFQFAVGTVAMF
jgi:hypothetical protein